MKKNLKISLLLPITLILMGCVNYEETHQEGYDEGYLNGYTDGQADSNAEAQFVIECENEKNDPQDEMDSFLTNCIKGKQEHKKISTFA